VGGVGNTSLEELETEGFKRDSRAFNSCHGIIFLNVRYKDPYWSCFCVSPATKCRSKAIPNELLFSTVKDLGGGEEMTVTTAIQFE
jgi:hypothetical protein